MTRYTNAEIDAMMAELAQDIANDALAEAAHLDQHGVSIAEAEEWTPPTQYEQDPDHLFFDVHAQALSDDIVVLSTWRKS